MNKFSKYAVKEVEKLYKKYVIEEYDVTAVAIGGSIARGHGCQGSDVDLLLFCKNIDQYQKKFPDEHSLNLELHYIPHEVLHFLYNKVTDILSEPITFGEKMISEEILGEKKCEHYKGENNSLNTLLSAWRELKKMSDTIIIYEKDEYYNNFCVNFLESRISTDKVLNMLSDLIIKEQSFETVIKIIKLSAIYQNEVFSKVLWIDRFLKSRQSAKEIIVNILGHVHSLPIEWIEHAKTTFFEASQIQKSMVCSICVGDIRRCNLGRCFHDYLNDTERAIKEGYVYGSWLSLKKSVDYAKKLASFTGMSIEMPPDYVEYWESKEYVGYSVLEELTFSLFNKKLIRDKKI